MINRYAAQLLGRADNRCRPPTSFCCVFFLRYMITVCDIESQATIMQHIFREYPHCHQYIFLHVSCASILVTYKGSLLWNSWAIMGSRQCRNWTNAAFQSPRANGAHDFEVGKIPVPPYVAFHSRTEPRWLIVLSCRVYYSYY